ncbi:MAG: hypothetical protein HY819_07400 [Acidobacteria bacterium]|nr:hypothetical protein [Acidobacteriota bacterium]
MSRYIKLVVCLVFFITTSVAYAFSSGPVAGRTGAPGELTCVDCHDSFELNRGPGRVDILDLPKTYSPGQKIKVRVSVQQNNQKAWGFQLTALDKQEKAVGQFVISDPVNTQLITDNNRFYVEHTKDGSKSNQPRSMEWTFDWIAPSSDQGPVTFYASGNAADSNGNSEGDFIYTTSAQIGAPSDPVISLSSPNGGEIIQGAKSFLIKWSSTNAISHDILIQLNGLTDIPKTIVSGLKGDVEEFLWLVPANIPTMRARIIVVAQGANSRADSDVSEKDFTILAGQQIPGPTITNIKVTNKKLVAEGSRFTNQTIVMVNSIAFNSAAKLNTTLTTLTQKGTATNGQTIGELIPAKSTVRLLFINPDGGVTEKFYTRP